MPFPEARAVQMTAEGLRLVVRCVLLPAKVALVPVALAGAALGAFAVTTRGRVLAFGLLALSASLLWLLQGLVRRPGRARRKRTLPGAIVVAAALALSWVKVSGPEGKGGNVKLQIEHFSTRGDPSRGLPSWGLWLPEADIVSLGIGLAPFVDPFIDREQARRIRALVMPHYDAAARDGAFQSLGSALGSCFRELMTFSFDDRHALAIIPRTQAPGAAPAATLIFLHGSGGNFAVYWEALSPLAHGKGIALVFPTFGSGCWNRNGGVEAILAAKRTACERFGLHPGRVFLAALSNGGRGATRVLGKAPGEFRGVAFLSAVVEDEPVAAAQAAGALQGLPILFVHGSADDRVPIESAGQGVQRMQFAGAVFTRRIYEGEGHFLLLSRLGDVLDDLASWMGHAPGKTGQ